MQLMLLCGESDTTLWPLSNKARSKPFIKLFKSSDGKLESMFQRVLRQIRESRLNVDISIVTSQSHLDSVISQGGKGISIITEQNCLNTFPVIVQATTYLTNEKGINENEIVIVMPCDFYTDSNFFCAISEMVNTLENGLAELVVLGIKPSEPSSKFDYIMPYSDKPFKVNNFIDKPNAETAGKLIADGALWNGGVYVFKLGFLKNIVSHGSNHCIYEDIRTNNNSFPQISFDDEVVKKMESVGVVEYSGKWKNLETWQSLSDELQVSTVGNVYSENNENTTILNELSLPIISRGCANIIIAATPDGILVSDKECAESIEETVKELSLRPMYEERRWGSYRVLDTMSFTDGMAVLTKCLVLKAGGSISYQRHNYREEVWTIVDGVGEVARDNDRQTVSPGDVIVIPIGMLHALRAITQLTLIEVQRGSKLEEEDIERFAYKW